LNRTDRSFGSRFGHTDQAVFTAVNDHFAQARRFIGGVGRRNGRRRSVCEALLGLSRAANGASQSKESRSFMGSPCRATGWSSKCSNQSPHYVVGAFAFDLAQALDVLVLYWQR
jgi:hypothetical protein